MSATHTVQDATGVIARADGGDIIIAAGTTVPGAVSGYATGCLFMDTDGPGVSTCLYANIGTSTAANFNPITVDAD